MRANRVRPNVQQLALAIFLMATTLTFCMCSVTCGQENQDQDSSKRKQVEGPLLNVLNGIPKKTDAVSADTSAKGGGAKDGIRPDERFRGKSDIELPTEALLKTAAFPQTLGNNLGSLDSAETITVASLFTGQDGKQLAEAFPTLTPPDGPPIGAFSKSTIETPPKLLLDLPAALSELQRKVSAKPDEKNKPAASSTAKPVNPAVQPGRVKWHADLAAATKQSKLSGKPIFHFQLLGQLDQRFT